MGYGKDSNAQTVALYWANAGAAPLLLPPLNGGVSSSARAINNQGVVCGLSAHTGGWQAVAWRINWSGAEPSVCGPIPLPTQEGDVSTASAINNNDEDGYAQIVGHFSVGDPTAAVAWTVQSLPGGTLTVVGTRIVEEGLAKALGLNDAGTICGEVGSPNQPVVWIGDQSAPLNLAHAQDIVDGSALAINNNGTIVGCASSGMVDDEAVVWPSADAQMVRLNKGLGRKSPFLFLVEACAVNDLGVIVGYGLTGVGGTARGAFLAILQ